MSIVRKSLEIQLETLFRFYDAHINNQKLHQHQFYADLKKKYSMEELNPHLVFLIDEEFIIGKNVHTRGGTAPFTSRISSKGIRIVQSLIDQSVPELEKVKASDLQVADKKKKYSVLKEVWDNRQEIYRPVIQFIINTFKELM